MVTKAPKDPTVTMLSEAITQIMSKSPKCRVVANSVGSLWAAVAFSISNHGRFMHVGSALEDITNKVTHFFCSFLSHDLEDHTTEIILWSKGRFGSIGPGPIMAGPPVGVTKDPTIEESCGAEFLCVSANTAAICEGGSFVPCWYS